MTGPPQPAPSPPVPEPLLRHLAARGDAARAQVDRLTAELADAQQLLTRLEVTHQTLLDLAGHDPRPAAPPLPPAYQDILGVLADHPDGIRPKDIALALNLPATTKNTVEGIRAELKRLVARDLATEPKPGLLAQNRVKSNERLIDRGRAGGVGAWGAGGDLDAGVCVAGPDRAGLRATGCVPYACGRRTGHLAADGGQVAQAVLLRRGRTCRAG